MAEDVADGRIIRLAGLPDFNSTNPAFKITGFEGWFATPTPDAVYTGNGGGAGAVASGAWLPKERPMVLSGFVSAERAELPGYARALAAALPTGADGIIECLGNGVDTVDLQIFVRRYDSASMPIRSRLNFEIPLLALDPYKYALTPLTGSMGVFSGQNWYVPATKVSSSWYAQATKVSSSWFLQAAQQVFQGPFGPGLTLTAPDGATPSRRITFNVVGPILAADWRLVQGSRELWVSLPVPDQQTLTIDCYEETAFLAGEDVTSYLYGDMHTLEPGGNSYQLTSPTTSLSAYATATAYPAYEI